MNSIGQIIENVKELNVHIMINTNNLVPFKESIESNSHNENLFVFLEESLGESLVDTILSILKMLLLCFILYLNGNNVTPHCIHHNENF